MWLENLSANIASKKIIIHINTMLCAIKVNSITIELIVHTSCYCVLDLLSVKVSVELTF